MAKTKKFKYNPFHYLKQLVRSIRNTHEKLKVLEIEGRTPYRMFLTWLLDTTLFGTLFMVVYAIFIGYDSILQAFIHVPGFGIGRWLLLTIIEQVSEKIKG